MEQIALSIEDAVAYSREAERQSLADALTPAAREAVELLDHAWPRAASRVTRAILAGQFAVRIGRALGLQMCSDDLWACAIQTALGAGTPNAQRRRISDESVDVAIAFTDRVRAASNRGEPPSLALRALEADRGFNPLVVGALRQTLQPADRLTPQNHHQATPVGGRGISRSYHPASPPIQARRSEDLRFNQEVQQLPPPSYPLT